MDTNNDKLMSKILKDILENSLTNTRPYVITDTSAHTGLSGYAIYALENSTFTTLSASYSGNSLTGETISAGHIWYLPNINSVTLASGAVIIYQKGKVQ